MAALFPGQAGLGHLVSLLMSCGASPGARQALYWLRYSFQVKTKIPFLSPILAAEIAGEPGPIDGLPDGMQDVYSILFAVISFFLSRCLFKFLPVHSYETTSQTKMENLSSNPPKSFLEPLPS